MMKCLSARNLKYMRRFAKAYPDAAFVQATLTQIPWFDAQKSPAGWSGFSVTTFFSLYLPFGSFFGYPQEFSLEDI